jgi:hypothetical protein
VITLTIIYAVIAIPFHLISNTCPLPPSVSRLMGRAVVPGACLFELAVAAAHRAAGGAAEDPVLT